MKRTDRVLCCCSGGQVRSVGCRYLLCDAWGMQKVLACGLDKNDAETLEMLFRWADVILVVGEQRLADKIPAEHRAKMYHLDIGLDTYRNCFSRELHDKLAPKLQALLS